MKKLTKKNVCKLRIPFLYHKPINIIWELDYITFPTKKESTVFIEPLKRHKI